MEDVKFNTVTKEQPPKKSRFRKFLRWFVFVVLVTAAVSFWWKYYFVFGEIIAYIKIEIPSDD